MAQQTAVEWYRQEIMKVLFASDDNTNIYENDIHEQALAMEKEQIMDAATWGYLADTGEQYYKEKYGNNNSN